MPLNEESIVMNGSKQEHIKDALEQANRLHTDQRVNWRMMFYTQDRNRLVFCAESAWNTPYTIAGYLLFHSPHYLRLPSLASRLEFALASWDIVDGFTTAACTLPDAVVISIRAGEYLYCIVCDDVEFFSHTSSC
jgi:hypothetical protein